MRILNIFLTLAVSTALYAEPTINIKKGGGEKNSDKSEQWSRYDIHGERKIEFGIGEANDITRQIGANALIRPPLQSINKELIRGRLSKNFIVKCSACHDDYANGIIGPSLLNKSAKEIKSAIVNYKNKNKPNALMVQLVEQMSDSEINAMSEEIAKFNSQFRSSK